MKKTDKPSKKTKKKFVEEYNELMSNSTFKMGMYHEWSEKGDHIEKFTMYENYTPVKTSSGTGTVV